MRNSVKYRLETAWIRARGYLSAAVMILIIGAVVVAVYGLGVAMSTPGDEIALFGLEITQLAVGQLTIGAQTQIVFASVAVIVCGIGTVLRHT